MKKNERNAGRKPLAEDLKQVQVSCRVPPSIAEKLSEQGGLKNFLINYFEDSKVSEEKQKTKKYNDQAKAMKSAEQIGSTIGLTATNESYAVASTKLVRVQFYAVDNGVLLQPVSGHNLWKLRSSVVISQNEYNERPCNPYNDTREAIWALNKCGWYTSDNDD